MLFLAETGRQTLAELILDRGLPKGSQRDVVHLAVFTHETEKAVIIGRADPCPGFSLPKPETVWWDLARVKQPLHSLAVARRSRARSDIRCSVANYFRQTAIPN